MRTLLPSSLLLTSLLFTGLIALPGCKSTPAKDTEKVTEAAAVEGAVAEAVAEPGKLFVEAVVDFQKYEVFDAAGTSVAKGDTNISTLELPEGEYTVVVHPGAFPEVKLGPVTVKQGKIARPRLTGFGLVKVKGSEDFIKFQIVDGSDVVVAEGDTNISTTLLPVGTYTARAGERSIELVVAEGEKVDFDSGF